jgi:hypothetical protein
MPVKTTAPATNWGMLANSLRASSKGHWIMAVPERDFGLTGFMPVTF